MRLPFNLNLGSGFKLGFLRSKDWNAGSFLGICLRKHTSGSGELRPGREENQYLNEQVETEQLGLSPARDLWKTMWKVSYSFSAGSC